MTGAKVTLKSSDPVNHNVNAKLKNNAVQLAARRRCRSIPFAPEAAERTPGEVICDIHPWMKACWMVLDNPYFAVTDEKGNFEIKNVPAGTQKVVVWQEAAKTASSPPVGRRGRTIKANDTTDKDFTIDPGKVRRSDRSEADFRRLGRHAGTLTPAVEGGERTVARDCHFPPLASRAVRLTSRTQSNRPSAVS